MRICAPVLAAVAVSVFWIPLASKSVTIVALSNTKCSRTWRRGAKRPLIGLFGFKLHLVVNDQGELLNVVLTPGNTDDRTPVLKLLQQLFGKVFADKGYVSQKLAQQLLESAGIELITKLKRNMKQRLMPLSERLMLRKRSIIETIIDQLKNISQIEHSRHRSPVNCFVNILCGLIGWCCHQPKKPAIAIDHNLLPSA